LNVNNRNTNVIVTAHDEPKILQASTTKTLISSTNQESNSFIPTGHFSQGHVTVNEKEIGARQIGTPARHRFVALADERLPFRVFLSTKTREWLLGPAFSVLIFMATRAKGTFYLGTPA
jgi:hypothetical protein